MKEMRNIENNNHIAAITGIISDSKSDATLIDECFGHCGQTVTNALAINNIITKMQVKTDFCQSCAIGKNKKDLFASVKFNEMTSELSITFEDDNTQSESEENIPIILDNRAPITINNNAEDQINNQRIGTRIKQLTQVYCLATCDSQTMLICESNTAEDQYKEDPDNYKKAMKSSYNEGWTKAMIDVIEGLNRLRCLI